MTAATERRPRGMRDLLFVEECDAWIEYLASTRGQAAARYVEVEPWAWNRLQQRLRAIRARRRALRQGGAQ